MLLAYRLSLRRLGIEFRLMMVEMLFSYKLREVRLVNRSWLKGGTYWMCLDLSVYITKVT